MADTHAKHHDYHLVNPSPWPMVGSVFAFTMAVGLIIWMRSMGEGAGLFGLRGPALFVVGVAGVALTHVHVVARRDQGSAWRRPHARRAASPALRHDHVHRLGGDVLRRLVLGLLRRLAVSCRRA